MKKGYKVALLIAVALVILAVLKPSKDNFKGFVKERYETIESGDSWNNIAKKSVINIGKSTINAHTQLTIEYEDKIFFALASRQIIDSKEEYLGVLGIWFKYN